METTVSEEMWNSTETDADSGAESSTSLWFVDDAGATQAAASVYVQFVLIVLLDSFCVVGNVLLIVCICKNRVLHTINNALILNLAVGDLLVALFVLPVWSANTLHQERMLPEGVCTAVAMVTFLLFLESMSTLGVIAFDRYLNICHPLRYTSLVTEWRTGMGVAYTWVQSLVLAALPLVGFGKYGFTASKLTICSVDFAHDTRYSILVIVLTIMPSWATIMVCYFKIFKVARMQFRRIHDMAIASVVRGGKRNSAFPSNKVVPQGVAQGITEPGSDGGHTHHVEVIHVRTQAEAMATTSAAMGTVPVATNEPADANLETPESPKLTERSVSAIAIARARLGSEFRIEPIPVETPEGGLWFKASKVVRNSIRQIRAFRTVFTIIGCFLACWTPYILLMLVTVSTRQAPNYTLDFVITFLAFSNSIANPVICTTINKDFRKALEKLLRYICPPWRKQQMMKDVVEAFATAADTSDGKRTTRAGSGTSSSIISEGTLRELKRMYF